MADFPAILWPPPTLVITDDVESPNALLWPPPTMIFANVGLVVDPTVAIITWVNRAYDTSIGAQVIWRTTDGEDITLGTSYPGPGIFDPTEGGNDTESHVVQVIKVSI